MDENGNEIDVISELKETNVNECFALTAFLLSLSIKEIITLCVVTAVSIVVIAKADAIKNDINTLVNGVRDGFISFWDRIKLMLGSITAIALEKTIELTESLALELYEVAKKRKDCYILCGTITGSGFIPIKYKFTNYENARNWIKKGGAVWSPYSTTAEKCIVGAGYVPMVVKNGVPYLYEAERHNISFTVGDKLIEYGFYHYHAGDKNTLKKNKTIHSFFGRSYHN